MAARRQARSTWAGGTASVAVGGDVHAPITTNVFADGSIPLADAVQDPASLHAELELDRFTGREWLVSDIDDFLGTAPCGYFLLEADAGWGKTAFAAWLSGARGYACHFTRLPGGNVESVARRNLAAQLIARYELHEFAPRDVLPPQSADPGWFEAVLNAAVTRARDRGEPRLVLVVDGLDEAEPSETGPPLGLPARPPAGVHVIATFRTGTAVYSVRGPRRTRTLQVTDPVNRADMRRYLEGLGTEAGILSRLDEHGVTLANFTETLSRRCDGIWVYLRYVLEEVLIGTRSPSEVDRLPQDLWAYYAENLLTLRTDLPLWDRVYLPVIAALGAAAEPVGAELLAAVAGSTEPTVVRRFLDERLRPFCEARTPGAPARYRFYHASLREFIGGSLIPDLHASADALREELAAATRRAHALIADHYLLRWGGLAEGLPLLAGPGTPLPEDPDDELYGRRHLVPHLITAGRTTEVHALLAIEYSGGNLWYAARESTGDATAYLRDIALARAAARRTADEIRAAGRPAAEIGLEIRYALISASLTSMAANIPAGLLARLLVTGCWEPERTLAHVRRIPDLSGRMAGYLAIRSGLDADLRREVAAETIDLLRALGDAEVARAIEQIVPWAGELTGPQREAVVSAARGISDLLLGQRALAAVLPLETDPRHAAAGLLGALAELRPDHRAAVLVALRGPAEPDRWDAELDRLAEELMLVPADWQRVTGLALVAPYLREARLAEAVTAVLAVGAELPRVAGLAGLLGAGGAEHRERVLASLLDTARAMDEGARARALVPLVSRVPEPERHRIIAEVVGLAPRLPDADRIEALTALAPHLDPGSHAQFANELLGHQAEELAALRLNGIIVLAALLPDAHRARLVRAALDALHTALDERTRLAALAELAPLLSAGQAVEALGAVRAITDVADAASMLAALFPHLPAAERPEFAGALLPALATVRVPGGRAAALASIIGQFDEPRLTEALALLAPEAESTGSPAYLPLLPGLPAGDRAELASGILDSLIVAGARESQSPDHGHDMPDLQLEGGPSNDDLLKIMAAIGPHLPPAQLDDAIAVARRIPVAGPRAEALALLLAHLPGPLPPDLVREVLDTGARLGAETVVRLLDRLGPRLAPDLVTAMAEQVLEATRRVGLPERARTLSALARSVPEESRPAFAEAAAGYLGRLAPDEYPSSRFYGVLAPYLTPARVTEAVTAARGMAGGRDRALALGALLPRLSGEPWREVAAESVAAATLPDPEHRTAALAAVLPHLPEPRRKAVVAAALDDIQSFPYRSNLEIALDRLAPDLPPERLEQLLIGYGTTAAELDWFLGIVVALAPALPGPALARAVSDALVWAYRLTDSDASAEAVSRLLPLLGEPARTAVLDRVVVAALASLDFGRRAVVLGRALPYAAPERRGALLDRALAGVRLARDVPAAYRGLGALAAHLPPSMLDRLLPAAERQVAPDEYLALAAEILPHLPDASRARHVRAIGPVTTRRDALGRALALAATAAFLPPGDLERGTARLLDALRTAGHGVRDRAALSGAVTSLRPHVGAPLWAALVTALQDVAARSSAPGRLVVDAALARHLPGSDPAGLLAEARNAAGIGNMGQLMAALGEGFEETPDPTAMGNVTTTLGPAVESVSAVFRVIPPDGGRPWVQDALKLARSQESQWYRAALYEALAPHLDADLALEVLAEAESFPAEPRGRTLLALIEAAAPDAREAVVRRALPALRENDNILLEGHYFRLLPFLAEEDRLSLLDDVARLSAPSGRCARITALLPYLPDGPRAAAVATARAALSRVTDLAERARLLGGLAPYLADADTLIGELVERADAQHRVPRLHAMSSALPHLPRERGAEVVAEIVAESADLPPDDRAPLLLGCLAYAPDPLRTELVGMVLAGVPGLGPRNRVIALAVLMPYLGDPALPAALRDAVDALAEVQDHGERPEALYDLALQVPPRELGTLFRLARAEPDPDLRGRCLHAVLAGARGASWASAPAEGCGPVRDVTDGLPRARLLPILGEAAEAIAAEGGPDAVWNAAVAVLDVLRWWP
ncbi:hypothetical protein DPM19_34060 [Actinomadura craniellae]|uniref:NACHT domain-containing protein n=1 Tax=Actinomadura craniellae TaxID=2231787 RepID=A0A365GXM9_9ACTN|nr:hypothetical protein [Actinomadura craniellae]RAY10683.1 hypothetical protein DPM19_34060 [Actinomadura craniellae]